MKDKIVQNLLFCSALVMVLLMAGVLYSLLATSWPVFSRSGFFRFVASQACYPLLAGTVCIAALALLVSVPFSISVALFTGVYYNGTKIALWIRTILNVSSAIPSILWGIVGYVLIQPSGVFSVSLVLAAMIIPYASSLMISLVTGIPLPIREGAYCLGATSTEVIGKVIFPLAKKGIIAIYLTAFGKALGETIIVSLLAGNTITAVILNQFETNSHADDLYALAFGLFLLTAGTNGFAKYWLRKIVL
jgi:phosphate transport system permease protein